MPLLNYLSPFFGNIESLYHSRKLFFYHDVFSLKFFSCPSAKELLLRVTLNL